MLSSTKYKKGEVVQNIVVVFIVVAMMVTGIGLFFGSLTTEYPSTFNTTSKYSGVMANASTIYNTAHGFQNTTEGMREAPDTQTGATGLAEFIPNAFGVLNFAESFFTAIVTMSGLPLGWVVNFMILLGIVLVAFAVANWLRGGSRGL
jgi:hypothetical protein